MIGTIHRWGGSWGWVRYSGSELHVRRAVIEDVRGSVVAGMRVVLLAPPRVGRGKRLEITRARLLK